MDRSPLWKVFLNIMDSVAESGSLCHFVYSGLEKLIRGWKEVLKKLMI